jgi:hypothetical protein
LRKEGDPDAPLRGIRLRLRVRRTEFLGKWQYETGESVFRLSLRAIVRFPLQRVIVRPFHRHSPPLLLK